jgi:hypothetical protein
VRGLENPLQEPAKKFSQCGKALRPKPTLQNVIVNRAFIRQNKLGGNMANKKQQDSGGGPEPGASMRENEKNMTDINDSYGSQQGPDGGTDLSELRQQLERLRELIGSRTELAPLAATIEAAIGALGPTGYDPQSTTAALQAFVEVAGSLGLVTASGGCLESCARNLPRDIRRYGLELATAIYLVCVAVCQLFSSGGLSLPTEPRPPFPPFPIPLPIPTPQPQPPIIQAPPIATATRRRCLVSVALLRVTYSGSDEGNDWRIRTIVQGREFRFRQRTIDNGDTSAFGQEVFNGEIGNCNQEITIDIVCKATEVDTPDANEVGTASRQVTLRCPSQAIITIPVTVDSAVMTFVVSIDAVCN